MTTKKIIFKNQNTFVFDNKTMAETPKGQSETVPGMALTIKQMIEKFNQGMTIPVSRAMYYPEDENDQELKIDDLTDLDQIKGQMSDLQEKMQENKEKQQKIVFKSKSGDVEGTPEEQNEQTQNEK